MNEHDETTRALQSCYDAMVVMTKWINRCDMHSMDCNVHPHKIRSRNMFDEDAEIYDRYSDPGPCDCKYGTTVVPTWNTTLREVEAVLNVINKPFMGEGI